ncbi:RraA family protein [Sediminicoccus rosea]|jgi:regulator of RNase E activity RraA|uniref:RraA family protein n=1 Tax=Sediminicoccus rosea TaxID=1225128 RepID=A0ABZ0PI90_9PROT|nr:RraA family protein [Sediminicoccus rosea]WPB85058.1 RraA family protein [Sediminicoccus rosea]
MVARPYTQADLDALCAWDTPTICNALELVVPARRGHGFTVRTFDCAHPSMPPICGPARVGTIRAQFPSGRTKEADRASRIGWYEYVANTDMPTVVVLQDLDDVPGTGAFWGEVNTNVHKGLKALGCVTNGSIRDLDMVAPGFQLLGIINPSHAYVHVVDWGRPVTVHGMQVVHDEVVHADRHGAVTIPADAVKALPAAIDLLSRKEAVILEMAKRPDFDIGKLREALAKSDDIH